VKYLPFRASFRRAWESLSRSVARQTPTALAAEYDRYRGALSRRGVSADKLWPVGPDRCPTLPLRGADSDLLSSATAEAMQQRGPRPD